MGRMIAQMTMISANPVNRRKDAYGGISVHNTRT